MKPSSRLMPSLALLVLGGVLLVLLWGNLCTVAAVPWNPARLAAAAAIAEGFPLYVLRDSGEQLGWFYGPGFPLWYAPAMLVPDISWLHVVAGAWNTVTLLAPLVLALRAAEVRGRRLAITSMLATLLLLAHGVAARNFLFIHVDVVCLAWGLTACLALHRWAARGGAVWLHGAALAAVLAVWTKQIAIALLPALLVWLWREHGRATAARFCVWLAVYGAAATAAIFAVFGAEEVLFNTVLIHLRNPNEGGAGLLLTRAGQLLVATAAWLPLVLLKLLHLRRAGEATVLPPTAASLVRLLGWAALWQLPLGASATLKVGGGLNSLHSLHYAFVAGVIWLGHQPWSLASRGRFGKPAVWTIAVWLVVLAQAGWLARAHGLRWKPAREQEELVRLARETPGRFYFPWNPLVTLREEQRVQPLDNALFCLWLAGLEPPVERIRAAVFPNPVLVYEEPAQSKFALRYFPAHKSAEK